MVEGCGETLPYQYSGVGWFMEQRPGWRGREWEVGYTHSGVVVAEVGVFCARAADFFCAAAGGMGNSAKQSRSQSSLW